MTTRTQDEILARYQSADDFLGFAREVLADTMTAGTKRQINPDLTVTAVRIRLILAGERP